MLMRQEDHPRAGVRRDQPGAGRGAWNSTRPTSLTSPGQSLPRGSPISFPGPLWEHLVGPEAIPPPLGEAKWQRWSQVLSKSDTLTNQEPHLLDQLSLHNRQKAGAHQLGPGPRGGSSPRPLEHGALQCVCARGLISLAYNPPACNPRQQWLWRRDVGVGKGDPAPARASRAETRGGSCLLHPSLGAEKLLSFQK